MTMRFKLGLVVFFQVLIVGAIFVLAPAALTWPVVVLLAIGNGAFFGFVTELFN